MRWVRGARRERLGEPGCCAGLHRLGVSFVQRIQGHEARIYKHNGIIRTRSDYGSRSRYRCIEGNSGCQFLKVLCSCSEQRDRHTRVAQASGAGRCDQGGVRASPVGMSHLVVSKLRETAINVQVAHPVRVRAFALRMRIRGEDRSSRCPGASRYGVVFSESTSQRRILTVRSYASC